MSFFGFSSGQKEQQTQSDSRHSKQQRPQIESPRGKSIDYQSLYETEKIESNTRRNELKQTQNQLEESQRQNQNLTTQVEQLQQLLKTSKEEGEKMRKELQSQILLFKQSQEQYNRLGQQIHEIWKKNFSVGQTIQPDPIPIIVKPDPIPIPIPKPKLQKFKVVVLDTSSVSSECLNAYRTHLSTLSDNLVVSNEGVSLVVRAAITERTETYFPKPLDPMCVPIALQRTSPSGSVKPPPLPDPYGNLVIVHFYSSKSEGHVFSYPKGVDHFVQMVKQIADKQN